MALKEVMQGRPLRSPVHPALVHLPIALFPLSTLLDLASLVLEDPEWQLVRCAFIALVAGLGSALVAAVFGMVDYIDIRDDHPAKKTATLHLVLNLVAVGMYGLGAGLRFGELDAARTETAPLVISLVALGVLGFSGYLGGHLVYSDGVAVGRHRRRTPLPQATIVIAPAKKGEPVAVAPDSALGEGETLRVDVGGTIVVIARIARGLHAFQEFCTHRFGPLSEGRIEGCHVVCPWHRSKFDVRNGQVAQGPAKIELRTFRVESQEGRIWLTIDPSR